MKYLSCVGLSDSDVVLMYGAAYVLLHHNTIYKLVSCTSLQYHELLVLTGSVDVLTELGHVHDK